MKKLSSKITESRYERCMVSMGTVKVILENGGVSTKMIIFLRCYSTLYIEIYPISELRHSPFILWKYMYSVSSFAICIRFHLYFCRYTSLDYALMGEHHKVAQYMLEQGAQHHRNTRYSC